MSLSSDEERAMSDEQLIAYLDFYQGVRMPIGTPRTLLLSKLNAVAVAARNI
jgi:hypothetical protein